MIVLDSVCEVGKSLSTKVEKNDGGIEVVNCVLKFSDVVVIRDTVDELLGVDVGWCQQRLYQEDGSPVRAFSIGIYGREHTVTGTIRGVKGDQVLNLLQAELTDLRFSLVSLGAVLEGKLKWLARGDEVEDVMMLLGKTCGIHWEVHDAGQKDMFSGSQRAAAAETRSKVTSISRERPQ